MDVSAVSNASVSQHFKAKLSSQVEVHKAEKNEESHKARHDKHSHGHSHRSRALDVFRTEIKLAIRASFRAQFPISQIAYAQTQGESSADDVANETLGVARQLVSDAPTGSGKALITFRARVHETATFVRETLGAQDDAIDDVVARVDGGLDELENEVTQNRESVATALEVDTRSKQRSTIKIRTQEGDVVKLSISRSDRTSISDASSAEDGNFSSTTEVEISSRSRLTLKVEGELNDEELTAIQNVFAQAESIADQFFGGDIAAAFDLATGFEFDTEQLARVKLGFRSYQSSSIAYTETTRSTPNIDAPTIAPSQSSPPISIAAPVVAPVVTAAVTAEIAEADVAQAEAVTEKPLPPAATSATDTTALSEFFGLVSDFLRSISDGFSSPDGQSSSSFQLHYSESFKLTLLSAVINAVAPDEADNSASTISTVIDGLAADVESLPA